MPFGMTPCLRGTVLDRSCAQAQTLPMILGYHIIFSTYGFWLPNVPRGSWSDFVGAWELFRFGRATKIDSPHSVADQPHDQKLRQDTKSALRYPPVQFNGLQARAVGSGFAELISKSKLSVWACA